jgi:hypothetical protein
MRNFKTYCSSGNSPAASESVLVKGPFSIALKCFRRSAIVTAAILHKEHSSDKFLAKKQKLSVQELVSH